MRIEGRKYARAYYNLEKYKARRPTMAEILFEQFGAAAAGVAQAAGTKYFGNVLRTDEEIAAEKAQAGLVTAQAGEAESKSAYYKEKPGLERDATQAMRDIENIKGRFGVEEEKLRGGSAERAQETAILPGMLDAMREIRKLEWQMSRRGPAKGSEFLKLAISATQNNDPAVAAMWMELWSKDTGREIPQTILDAMKDPSRTKASTRADLDAANRPGGSAGDSAEDKMLRELIAKRAAKAKEISDVQNDPKKYGADREAAIQTLMLEQQKIESTIADIETTRQTQKGATTPADGITW